MILKWKDIQLHGPEFIIPPGYIAPESTTTTTSVPLKDASKKNPLAASSKQPRIGSVIIERLFIDVKQDLK